MNNKNQVLELKQQGKNSLVYTDNKTGKQRNGDYKARLANGGVYLNNGDTLRLNQVFLETDEVEEDVIVIEDTLTLRIDYIRYLKDVDNIVQPNPSDRTYTGTSGSTTDPLTMSIPLDKTPSFLVNQNTFNAYGGASFNSNNSHGYYQRKGEIYTEALNIGLNDFANNLNHRNLVSISFSRKDKGKPSSTFNCEVAVTNSLGNNIKITVSVPPMSLLSEEQTVTINFFCIKDVAVYGSNEVFKIVNELQMNEANIELERHSAIVPANFAQLPVFCPNIVTKTVRLPAGNYHAQELGQLITNLFTDSNLSSGEPLGNSSSVIQQPSLMVLADQDLNTIGTTALNIPEGDFFHQNAASGWRVFVKAKDSNRFNWYGAIGAMQRIPNNPSNKALNVLKNDPPIYAGSDSFGLVYDNEVNKFKFERIHTSIRDNVNNQPSVQILDNPTITSGANAPFPPDFYHGSPSTYVNSPQHSYMATSYGGIIMTNLSASKVDGGVVYVDFWEKLLGFDLSIITKRPTQTGNTLATKTGNTFHPTGSGGSDNIIDYQSDTEQIISYSYGGLKANDNITEDISSIDGLHNISTTSGTATSRGHKYYNLIDVVNFDTASKQRLEQFINTTETSQIFASNQLQTQNISFAYYLIDINANIENDFLNEEGVKKNIFSVINRYYVQGGYLSGTNSGVEYVHEGEPMLISDFDIRILKPTGEVADNLKEDNTIFLEIIRA